MYIAWSIFVATSIRIRFDAIINNKVTLRIFGQVNHPDRNEPCASVAPVGAMYGQRYTVSSYQKLVVQNVAKELEW